MRYIGWEEAHTLMRTTSGGRTRRSRDFAENDRLNRTRSSRGRLQEWMGEDFSEEARRGGCCSGYCIAKAALVAGLLGTVFVMGVQTGMHGAHINLNDPSHFMTNLSPRDQLKAAGGESWSQLQSQQSVERPLQDGQYNGGEEGKEGREGGKRQEQQEQRRETVQQGQGPEVGASVPAHPVHHRQAIEQQQQPLPHSRKPQGAAQEVAASASSAREVPAGGSTGQARASVPPLAPAAAAGEQSGGGGGQGEGSGTSAEAEASHLAPLVPPGFNFSPKMMAGPIEQYLSAGHKLPILLITCDRAELLKETLRSLQKVRGLDLVRDVLVVQDGDDKAVAQAVKSFGMTLEQHVDRKRSNTKDGAVLIAQHYKYALTHAFNKRPDAPGVIIVEDDMLFSPDFVEYFEANAPLLERDPKTFVLSSWNDNGFRSMVSDPAELQRTEYFPGLGWLLPRRLWKGELEAKWPKKHWDHWMRSPDQHGGRESVFPEVPRIYHNGAKGTFMDVKLHDKLFKDIDYNLDASFSWSNCAYTPALVPCYAQAEASNYEARVESRLKAAVHTNDLLALEMEPGDGREIAFWYSVPPASIDKNPLLFKLLAGTFGLWHELRRTSHKGMHSFHHRPSEGKGLQHVMLINAAETAYSKWKPKDLPPATEADVRRAVGGGASAVTVARNRARQLDEARKGGLRVIPSTVTEQSCTDTCAAAGDGLRCVASLLPALNECSVMKKYFPCQTCGGSFGAEQPAYVVTSVEFGGVLPGGAEQNAGQCLLTSDPDKSTCEAGHAVTKRLCPCQK